ncbi:MAG: hypothetical protein WBV22_06600 [Anaerolineaceae bacterium]
MKKYQSISFISGILVVLIYLTFALLAFIRYPLPYTPIRNWFSDLGNINLNPGGAIFYNTGIIATASLLILFFLGLSSWKMENKRVQNIMLLLSQGFGILGSICMIMSAIFPINIFKVHSFWSTSLYVMLSTAFVFSVAALRYHRNIPLWLLILGLSTALVVMLTSILQNVYILEWITVLLFLSYVFLVGLETRRLASGG